jgi:PHP family Zn ribbon phosphoesterase
MMRPLPKDTMQRIAFADFHLHSRYSRATSENMDIPTIVSNARLKGLGILGTGDFTHPDWMKHLKSQLVQIDGTGLYITQGEPEIYFLATSEVCTIFRFEEKTRKIHHLILSPSLDVAEQVSDRLATFGDLEEDGRPILKMSAPELVETVVETSKDNIVIPAHAWTPWFSLFGSINGFDSLNDCYQDEAQHISALESHFILKNIQLFPFPSFVFTRTYLPFSLSPLMFTTSLS